ncbi:hypothetical protein NIES4071_104470 (plasmid) [Calothrix sp. NIES-4071]|nr:hypothetical protein NIES4071_104470 [Calothrix sp. NIES-4071]BAZ64434.1 hypothetical protein NIES4105_101670 [Calothrix sp. NIES-4105]
MKKLIYTVAFTLVIASSVPAAFAENPNDAKVTHLGNSRAFPNDSAASDATHKFEVHVQGKAVSELAINLPEGVKVNRGIEVTNKSGQKIPATVSMDGKTATVAFSEPVAPGNSLLVSMKGVNASSHDSSQCLHYQVSAKKEGTKEATPLGLTKIRTYQS